jgi:hypothetical protein
VIRGLTSPSASGSISTERARAGVESGRHSPRR